MVRFFKEAKETLDEDGFFGKFGVVGQTEDLLEGFDGFIVLFLREAVFSEVEERPGEKMRPSGTRQGIGHEREEGGGEDFLKLEKGVTVLGATQPFFAEIEVDGLRDHGEGKDCAAEFFDEVIRDLFFELPQPEKFVKHFFIEKSIGRRSVPKHDCHSVPYL